jgi:hypothetical protein
VQYRPAFWNVFEFVFAGTLQYCSKNIWKCNWIFLASSSGAFFILKPVSYFIAWKGQSHEIFRVLIWQSSIDQDLERTCWWPMKFAVATLILYP